MTSIKSESKLMNEQIASHFAESVRKGFGSHLKHLILFGSRARDDFSEGSDFDFLIVLDKKSKEDADKIRKIEVDILNTYNELAGSIVCDENEWERLKSYPIGLNILKEGMRL